MRKFPLLLVLCGLVPVAARAQFGTGGPTPFGSGEQPILGFSGSSGPKNSLLFTVAGDTGYTDNVINSNANKQGDEFGSFGPHLTYLRQEKRFTLDIDYNPYFTVYRRLSEWNTVNQSVGTDVSYRFSPHWSVRERNSASYFYYTGASAPFTGDAAFPPLGPPSGVTNVIYAPGTRNLNASARLDLIYRFNGRTSLDFFGSYTNQSYSHSQTDATLSNYRDAEGGVALNYRLSRKDTISIVYTYDQMQVGGGASQQKVHNWVASYARQLSSTVSFTLFGGPTYVKSHQVVDLTTPIFGTPTIPGVPIVSSGWHGSAGGNLSWHGNRTSAVLSGQRVISGGYGLQGAGIFSGGSVQVGRRLMQHWNLTTGVSYTRLSLLNMAATNSNSIGLRNATGDLYISRALTDRLNFVIGYTYLRQLGNGTNSLLGNIDNNRATIGFYYNAGRLSLGR